MTVRRDGAPRRPVILFLVSICVVIGTIALTTGLAVLNMRDSTLRNAETNLKGLSVALAEQANRIFHGVDLLLSGLTDRMEAGGLSDTGVPGREMAGRDMHFLLGGHLTGRPYLAALGIADAQGRVLNTSRFWPPPAEDVSAQEYFLTLRRDPLLVRFVSRPERNPATGQWEFSLVRRLASPDGGFAGVVFGTISLDYFDDVYGAVSRGSDQVISLLRQDDILLARFPATDRTGMPVVLGERHAGTRHRPGPGSRVKAAAELADFPMFVRVTQAKSVVLRDWTSLAWMIGLVSLGCVMMIGVAAVALGRWWRQLQTLGVERAERAEAEKARALAEADLARERVQHAEEASRAKSGFLAMMSHEIRTPMNGVLGLTGTLLDSELAPQQRRIVEAIRDSGDSLLRILNDILDLSKLDAGRMTFEDMAFSPVTLTHGIVSILGPRGRAKGLIITVSCDHALPGALLGDAGRIRQVLLNLVSNAIKFTEEGSVTIECRVAGGRSDSRTIQWVIRDTGIGIAADRIGALFGDFVQADATITRRFGGSGMGLSISRRLIEQMGGTISAESTLGQGTTFRVNLELPVTEAVASPERRAADVVATFDAYLRTLGRPLRLLFAEDNPTNQFVALQMLRAFNVQVDVAGDGLEAIDAATTFLYDVICMDMRMPEMDGLDATRLIRRQGGRLAQLPIIALTANAFPEDVKACLDAGMDLFLAKPVQKETLLNAILTALGAVTSFTPPGSDGGAASAEPQPVGAKPEPSPLALDVLTEMEDAIGQDGIIEMVQLFQSETAARLARLMQPTRDLSIDLREVHTLKGAAATVGAPVLTELAVRIEESLREGGMLTQDDVVRLQARFDLWCAAINARISHDQYSPSL